KRPSRSPQLWQIKIQPFGKDLDLEHDHGPQLLTDLRSTLATSKAALKTSYTHYVLMLMVTLPAPLYSIGDVEV
ncbi:MAG: hypothetical protein ACE5Q6_21450, partial [Dehalococcoidia bacterium]